MGTAAGIVSPGTISPRPEEKDGESAGTAALPWPPHGIGIAFGIVASLASAGIVPEIAVGIAARGNVS